MNKNPVINSLIATLYIVAVSSVMFYAGRFVPGPDTILAPITVLSLFSLSAAIMGYLFFYQPIILILDGKKKEGVDFFLKTLGSFAVTTFVIILILFSGIIT